MNSTIKLAAVKLDAGFTLDNKFFITYRQNVAKGEKFDREKSEIFHTSEYDIAELPDTIFIDCPASRHGLKQKMCDNLALRKEDKAATSIEQAITMEDELWAQLIAGNWNAVARGPKAASIKLTDMEAKFLSGVTTGITTWEAANDLYKSITGKELPKLEEN